MIRNRLFATTLAVYAVGAAGDYDYAANTGALSYTFFNLSPYKDCLFVAFGSGANSAALSGNPGQAGGWNSGTSAAGFFNSPFGSSHDAYDFYIFWDEEDPITAASPAAPDDGQCSFQSACWDLKTGWGAAAVEFSSAFGSSENPPAIADSWTLTCADAKGTSLPSGSPVVIANVASASNLLESGNSTVAPYKDSTNGSFYNAGVNPPSPGAPASTTNPNGMGFTTGTMNFNPSSGTIGGLWSGLYNPNTYAVTAVNAAMYPINLSAYVANPVVDSIGKTAAALWGGHFTIAVGDPFILSSYAAKTLAYLAASPILALQNDSLNTANLPTMVNYLVTTGASGQGVFMNSTISNGYLQWLLAAPGLAATTLQTLNTAAGSPITNTTIWGGGFAELAAVTTDALVGGVGLAAGPAAAVGTMAGVASSDGTLWPLATSTIDANFAGTASNPPSTATAPPVINATYSASNLLGLLLANSVVQAQLGNTLGFTVSQSPLWSNDSINTANLCTAITLNNNLMSGTCGTQQGTPAYTNVLSTYPNSQSTTQLSIWDAILTGADITAVNGSLQVANPTSAAFSPPVQVVNNGQTASLVAGINVTFNSSSDLLSLVNYATAPITPAGAGTTAAPTNAPSISCTATGVYSGGCPTSGAITSCVASGTSYASTTGILSIPYYVYYCTSPGYVDMRGTGPFSNGTQTIDLTGCVPNASVQLQLDAPTVTGSLTCQASYPLGGEGSYPVPSAAPTVTLVVPMSGGNTYNIAAPNVQDSTQVGYDASTGVLTVNGYQIVNTYYSFQNGPQTLNTTACPSGTGVLLSVYPIGENPTLSAGFLSCQGQPTLPYGLCVGDLQATGGVLAALMTEASTDGSGATFDFGCVCIPSYLGGPLTPSDPDPATGPSVLGGVLVGARSAYPNAQCN